jgi:hypothetical protein
LLGSAGGEDSKGVMHIVKGVISCFTYLFATGKISPAIIGIPYAVKVRNTALIC